MSAAMGPSRAEGQTYFPNRGALVYDGVRQVDVRMIWDRPGGWWSADPAYGQRLHVRSDWATRCESWTTLPYPYDACWLALSQWGYYRNFWFGSYHPWRMQWGGTQLVPGLTYAGVWRLAGGVMDHFSDTSAATDFWLWGAEYRRNCGLSVCPSSWDHPMFLTKVRQQLLLTGTLVKWRPFSNVWFFGY
jgi:hypothetical protein